METDKATRDKAVRGLSAFICDEANAQLSPPEMAKLWKGIFYCSFNFQLQLPQVPEHILYGL